MHLSRLDFFYWIAGFVGHSALLAILIIRRRFQKVPVFSVWIASNLARTLVLAFVARYESHVCYYYVYWALAIVDTFLQLGVVYEMYSLTFRPLGNWAGDVRGILWSILICSVSIAALLTALADARARLPVEALTVRGNLFSSIWMSELFVAMIAIAIYVGLPWGSHVIAISQGLGVYSLFGVLVEAGNSYFGLEKGLRAYGVLSHVRMTLYLACLVYWMIAMWKQGPDTLELPETLHKILIEMQARMELDLRRLNLWRYRR